MATQWAPGPLHLKDKIRVFLLQKVLFALVVYSVGVSQYGHYTAQNQESSLDSGATNKAFFIKKKTHDAEPQDTHQRATPGNRKLPLSTSFHFQQPSIPLSHPHFHQNYVL